MQMLKSCLLVMGLCSGSVYAAVIPCAELPANQYAGQECTAGEYVFKDIAWNSLGPPNNPEYVRVPASEVLLHPVFTGTSVGMLFSSDQFNIGPDQRIRATLFYYVDPDPPIFDDLSLEFFAQSPVGDSVVTLTMTFCAGARFVPSCEDAGGQLGEFSLTWAGGQPNPGPKTFQLDQGVNVIDAILTLDMYGGTVAGGGRAQIDGVRASSVVTPEPASIALTALGGLALLFARRGLGRR